MYALSTPTVPTMLGSSYRGFAPSAYAAGPSVYAPVFGNVTIINQINLQVINNIAINSPGALQIGGQTGVNSIGSIGG